MIQSLNYYNVRINSVFLDENELYILMGYGIHTPPVYILDIVDEMFTEICNFCNPRCSYLICKGGRYEKDKVKIKDTIFNTGAIIASAMKEAEQIAIFTATLGIEFDSWLNKINREGDIVKEFVANSLGSILAEGVVTNLMNEIEQEMLPLNLKISNNYSPGYCDWSLGEQSKLFSILPSNISGIQLTDSCMMLPIKSVNGIIAIGKDVKKRAYKCDVCNMKNCIKNINK
ncbi:hypothetical protein D0T84_10185 [Dysgonomonas sp. 521]|uniref:vitamin B12 dependent-methionine synthase activation domain-containing protein n=1 Tax=Dysgonomonas sp. 521 TaxID=2302932 RepID=UPI0013D74830|nr:vitamin B12 dependent-methionine synthase activation domain-containing protein [Dysgonomonas sp. 521]NDV95287.1 hypothetical protein [Dysgonomonas sp. 521]